MKGTGRIITALALAALVVVITPPAAEAFLPDAISDHAREIDRLFYILLAITGFIFILTQGLLVYAIMRWRRRSQDERAEATFSENVPLELVWTAVPTVIVIFLAVVSWQVLADIWEHPDDALVVDVTAHQWSWEFHYPDYDISASELVVPVDEPVHLRMTSSDVIHSLWVPELRVKQDIEPGRVTEMSFIANTTGEFRVPCTEYCGIGHAEMIGTLHVMAGGDFDAWLVEMGQDIVDEPPDDADVYLTVNLIETPGETPGGWGIDPHVIEVNVGEKVAIEVINGPDTEGRHNLVIEGPFGVRSRDLAAGESTWISFTAEDAGEFEMLCDIPGHRSLGMVGTVVVQ